MIHDCRQVGSISAIISTKTNIRTIHHVTEKGGTVVGLCGSLNLPQDRKRRLCIESGILSCNGPSTPLLTNCCKLSVTFKEGDILDSLYSRFSILYTVDSRFSIQ